MPKFMSTSSQPFLRSIAQLNYYFRGRNKRISRIQFKWQRRFRCSKSCSSFVGRFIYLLYLFFFCFVFFYTFAWQVLKKNTCVTRAWTCLKIAYWLKEDWVRRFQHGKQLEQDSYSRQRCFCCNNRGSSKCIFKHSFSSRKGQVRAKMLKILKLFSR